MPARAARPRPPTRRRSTGRPVGATSCSGASARVGGRSGTDERAVIFGDGDREVAVWLYPDDPDLPGLRRAAVPDAAGRPADPARVLPSPGPTGDQVARRDDQLPAAPPGRAQGGDRPADGPRPFFVKVLREAGLRRHLARHELLLGRRHPGAGGASAATADFCWCCTELPGRPLARAHLRRGDAVPGRGPDHPARRDAGGRGRAAAPAAVDRRGRDLRRDDRAALPSGRPRSCAGWCGEISTGLAGVPPGYEATHGDFHEGQLFVTGGRITGVLDIDTVGPGRRADDLACLVAHLSTVQRMTAEQAGRAEPADQPSGCRSSTRRVDPSSCGCAPPA